MRNGNRSKMGVAEKQSTTGITTVAAGSALMVKLSEGFNSRHNKKGQRFKAVLESNLMSGKTLVASKGSPIYGVLTEVKNRADLQAAQYFALN